MHDLLHLETFASLWEIPSFPQFWSGEQSSQDIMRTKVREDEMRDATQDRNIRSKAVRMDKTHNSPTTLPGTPIELVGTCACSQLFALTMVRPSHLSNLGV
jgi:hypothetical protein